MRGQRTLDRGLRDHVGDVATFTVFTVNRDDVQVIPMTVDDDGHPVAFYLTPS